MKRYQSGISIIDVLIASALAAALTLVAVRGVISKGRQAALDEAIVTANMLAQTAESNQARITASDVDPTTGVFSYTRGGRRANFTASAELEGEIGRDLPDRTPWGTIYEYRANGFPAQVRFRVPAADAALIQIPATVTAASVPGGDVVVTVQALRNPRAVRNGKLAYVKSRYYLETSR